MAYRNDSSRRSSVSNADSGISSLNLGRGVNSRYACFWCEGCQGRHELDDCPQRESELRGKLGIYYCTNGVFKRYLRDEMNNLSLRDNPTGSTMFNLLIYKHENDQTWVLFVMKHRRDKQQNGDESNHRQYLLALPSSSPRQRNERPEQIARRALETITTVNAITQNLRSRLRRFLFVDAAVIYPLHLTNDQAQLLTDSFSPNEEVLSLHWFPLPIALDPDQKFTNYLSRDEEGNNLAQVRHFKFPNIVLNDGDRNLTMWSVLVGFLVYIENHVGLERFLN